MDYTLLLVSSVLVSIDAALAGVSLGIKSKYKFKYSLTTLVIVLIMTLLSFILAYFIKKTVHNGFDIISGVLFIIIGLKSLFDVLSKNEKSYEVNLLQICSIGFAIGIDASVATFTLSLSFFNILVPLIVTFMHFAFLSVGWVLSNIFIRAKGKVLSLVSSIFFIVIGSLKISGVL